MFTRHWVCVCACVVSDTVQVVWGALGQTVPFPAFPTWILLPYLVAGGGTTSRPAQLGAAQFCVTSCRHLSLFGPSIRYQFPQWLTKKAERV